MSPAFKYGLVTGAGFCLWLLAEFALGFHTTRPDLGQSTRYFSGLIPLVLLTLLLRQRRAAAPDGQLPLGQGLRAGMQCSLVASLVFYAFVLVYQQFINPAGLDLLLDWKVAQLRAAGVAESAVRATIVSFRQFHSPLGLVVHYLVIWPLLGLGLSGLITLGLRRTRA
jgi:hypothetical protein